MKKTIILLPTLISTLFMAQIQWMTLPQALEAEKTSPRKILISFYADWCAPCKQMEVQTFGHPVISKLINASYYAVRFNSEGDEAFSYMGKAFNNPDFGKKHATHPFTKFMSVTSVPSTVILDEHAMPITNLSGFLTAKELEPYLVWIQQDTYKEIKTRQDWDTYRQKFKSSIK